MYHQTHLCNSLACHLCTFRFWRTLFWSCNCWILDLYTKQDYKDIEGCISSCLLWQWWHWLIATIWHSPFVTASWVALFLAELVLDLTFSSHVFLFGFAHLFPSKLLWVEQFSAYGSLLESSCDQKWPKQWYFTYDKEWYFTKTVVHKTYNSFFNNMSC